MAFSDRFLEQQGGQTGEQIEEMKKGEKHFCNSLRWCYPGQVQRVSSQATAPPLQKTLRPHV